MSTRPRPDDVVPDKDEELHPTVVLERPKVTEFPARFRSRDAAAEPGPRGADSAGHWRLEAPGDGRIKRLSLHHLPFRVGRRMDLELVLSTSSISKVHAEIYAAGGTLCVRDLGSTNGTFVNGQRVLEAPLREGDVLHFAKLEYRLARDEPKPAPDSTQAIAADTTQSIDPRSLSHLFPPGTRELKELLRDGAVTVLFQPIVRLPDGAVAAYEALGRGRHPRLPEAPIELFKIAESLGPDVAAELSRLFRRKAVELVKDRQELPTLFLNTHPAEMAVPGLIDSLESLRSLLHMHSSACRPGRPVLRPVTPAGAIRGHQPRGERFALHRSGSFT